MHVPGTSPPITSKSVPGPFLMFISELVTQALRLTGSGAAINAGLVVSVGMGTSMRVEVGAAEVFRKLKTRSRRTVMVPNIPKRLTRLSLCGGVIGFANGLRIVCTARAECFFMAIYLPKVLNVASTMTS